MRDKYFNKWESKQIISYIRIDPVGAKSRFEQYFEKYPEDYSLYTYYVADLITLGYFEDAEKILDYVEEIFNSNQLFIGDLNKLKILKYNIMFNKLRLLSYQGKYDELYKLCLNNKKYIKSVGLDYMYFYATKKLGMEVNSNKYQDSYLFRQMVNYNESNFFEHIKKHLTDYIGDVDYPNKAVFVSDFPLNKVLEEIKKYKFSDKRLFSGFYEDEYIFKYNNCGRDNNKLTDYFKIVSFNNTVNFITMCPSSECENLPYIDLNYLINDSKDSKGKRISQIEKFNKRYNIN